MLGKKKGRGSNFGYGGKRARGPSEEKGKLLQVGGRNVVVGKKIADNFTWRSRKGIGGF